MINLQSAQMFKILVGAIFIILIGTGLAFFKYFDGSTPKPSNPDITDSTPKTKESTSSSTANLLNKIKEYSTPQPLADTSNENLEAHIRVLESTVTVLQKRLDTLEQTRSSSSTTTSSTTTSKQPPSYITLGTSGSGNSQTYANVDTFQVNLDSADFAGYSNVQLEVNMKLPDIVGTAYAKLYNLSDGVAVEGSEVSTTSGSYVWLTSGNFKLASGKKTYILQIKSTESRTINIQTARLKISF